VCSLLWLEIYLWARVARFVLVKHTKTGGKYTIWPQHLPCGHKICQMANKYIYQHYPFQGTPKFTRIGTIGMKINHLAKLGNCIYVSFYKKVLVTLQRVTYWEIEQSTTCWCGWSIDNGAKFRLLDALGSFWKCVGLDFGRFFHKLRGSAWCTDIWSRLYRQKISLWLGYVFHT
jgi:hypothetical protein